MDLQTIIFVYILIITTTGYNSAAQQIFQSQVQIASKPAQNNYIRLSEIPFENAVRAVATPPRDYVPIHEAQQDSPPPQRPQPVQNQQGYNTQPQTYSNVVSLPLAYNTASIGQPISSGPMSFQYMLTNQFPNEIFSQLHHTIGGSNVYLQQNNGYRQNNNGYLQVSNDPQGSNGYTQANNGYLQGNNGHLQTNNAYSQGSNGYHQANTGYPQNINGYFQGNSFLQQANNPNLISGYQTPVTYIPVRNNNIGATLSPRIKSIPVYSNNNFKSNIPSGQNNIITLNNYQNQISSVPRLPTLRFRSGKSTTLALPSNNNVQYSNNGFASKSMYVPARSPRMTSADYGPVFSMGNKKYAIDGIEYMYLL